MRDQYILSAYLPFLICLLMACNLPVSNPDSQDQDWIILEKGNQCAVESAQQIILKTEAELNDFWEESFSGFDMAPDQASVDFNDKWVVASFMGMQRKGGFSIEVGSLTENEQSTEIVLQHLKPGPDCMSTMSIEFPYLIFSVEKPTSGELTFKINEKIYGCE